MAEEKVRLGGMALANGVLVHGPTAWACAVRTPEGRLAVVSDYKRLRADGITLPLARGPARLVELLALLPELRRRVPEARLPFERPAVLGAMVAAAAGARLVRRASGLSPSAQELVSAVLALAPATVALRGGELAAYHGAEHVSIGTYEHGEPRQREHERCGSHLVGPLLVTSAAGAALAAKAPARIRGVARLVAAVGAVGVSMEIFGWMTRRPEHPVARALARPGHELQHRLATSEPRADQLEVAGAALAACLELERGRPDRD